MFAQVGKRWSLSTVCWWGGWAEGEHVSDVNFLLSIHGFQFAIAGHTYSVPTRWTLPLRRRPWRCPASHPRGTDHIITERTYSD
jgi:hypothetical protein